MATVAAFLAAARAELGYVESPKGTNCNKFSRALGRPCEAWCADFLVAIADRVGLDLPSRSASTQRMREAFAAAGRLRATPAAGDFTFWQFDADPASDHVSVVESFDRDTVTTIDGNSSTSGSQSNGGAVVRRTRSRKSAIAYGRPAYATAPAPAPPTPQPQLEDDMFIAWDPDHAWFVWVDPRAGLVRRYLGNGAGVRSFEAARQGGRAIVIPELLRSIPVVA